MIKREELKNPASCMNRAREDEMTFVLLGRDPAAPIAIRSWVHARIRLQKNKPDDPQIKEALACAEAMELYQVKDAPVASTEPTAERASLLDSSTAADREAETQK